jgi:threonine/homoserine/homoserine lactone efflux protein
MNTKLILTISSILLAVIGLSLTFAPDEILVALLYDESKSITLIFQLLGALYVSFAMVNWNIKDGRIGGIYNKPIALGNFTHFLIGGLALGKALFSNPELPILIWILGGFYLLFAVIFWIITFTHPKE